MLYYNFADIILSMAYSVFWGALLCFLSLTIDTSASFIKGIIGIPSEVFLYSKDRKSVTSYLKSKRKFCKESGTKYTFLVDLIFCVIAGVLYSILFYVTADGEIRFYVFLLSFFAYKGFKKTVGKWIRSGINFVFHIILKLLCSIFVIIAFSLRVVLRKLLFCVSEIPKRFYSSLAFKISKTGEKKRKKSVNSLKKLANTDLHGLNEEKC
ncbi:MAG: hypothetical protein E7673_03755 [Ruminococcaceae bacterium]|nr:hypothetical protein [Oscillospiraceae bacterium]